MSRRPCSVVTEGVLIRRASARPSRSVWKWMTSNSSARAATCSSMRMCGMSGSTSLPLSRRAECQPGTSLAAVTESPLANRVT
jgi:hypothetical protein